MVFLRNLGIYGQTDYKSMITVHKTTEGYQERIREKPSRASGRQVKAD